ncbi:MAG: uroporphyrinogen decarboxylase family protein [Verrucomicrobiota bacterium]
MTSRERLLAVLHGDIPDCVPCCPDISNMVPCRLTGKPFWDIYAFQDPPLWKAHIDALKFFDIDGGFELYDFGTVDPVTGHQSPMEERVVHRYQDGSFVTQKFNLDTETWAASVVVYTADNPPATNVKPATINLPETPPDWELLTGVKEWPKGFELWKMIRRELGDQGVLAQKSGMTTRLIGNTDDVYAHFDNPESFRQKARRMMENVERRMELIGNLDPQPDFLLCGGSGSLMFTTPDTWRELVLPVLKKTTALAKNLGIPTHVHCCGPEKQLVAMAAEETDLTIIDPLEVPPMGDCDLAELKKRFGSKIVLKGNLHTTQTMLKGSVEDVRSASKKAIDDAGRGGGFILSTGDQCGRDTPDENIRTMIDVARNYGQY